MVRAYEQWGEHAVPRLRGMFAFGIVDERDGHLFLARDPLGIKPLYYAQTPGLTAFASELQALRRVPGLEWTLDLQAIDQYLRLQYIPAPRTVYAQVRKLPPAHTLRVEFDGRTHGPREYWRLQFRPDFRRTEDEWLRRSTRCCAESVRAHLVSDVPFGAFLSGGLDSSAVVAYMAQELNEPVETFSIGFEEQDFSELHYAERAAHRWQTHHHVEVVRPDCLELLSELVHHYGEPFSDSSALPTFLVSRIARRQVPMVLSGDGGDKAFGGYNDYATWRRWLMQDNQPVWKHRGLPTRPTLEAWLSLKQQTAPDIRRALWRPELRAVTERPIEPLEAAWRRARGATPAQMAQAIDIQSYLPVLDSHQGRRGQHDARPRGAHADRRSRGLRVRSHHPRGPVGAPRRGGRLHGQAPAEGADVPVLAGRLRLPAEDGLGVPLDHWFAPGRALHAEVRRRLISQSSPLTELLDPATVATVVDQGTASPIWLLLFLDEWLTQQRDAAAGEEARACA